MKNTSYIKAATLIATVGLATGLKASVIYNTTQAVWWETGPVNAYRGLPETGLTMRFSLFYYVT